LAPDSSACARLIPEELVEFFDSGVTLLVATVDVALHPEVVRGAGASMQGDRSGMTVYLNEALAARTVANLEATGSVAVCFTRPIDYRSVQVKGRATRARAVLESERPRIVRYHDALVEALYLVGVTRAASRRVRHWPCVAFDMVVEEMFHQTPGPGAGKRLET
jgi:hypothetical protein